MLLYTAWSPRFHRLSSTHHLLRYPLHESQSYYIPLGLLELPLKSQWAGVTDKQRPQLTLFVLEMKTLRYELMSGSFS